MVGKHIRIKGKPLYDHQERFIRPKKANVRTTGKTNKSGYMTRKRGRVESPTLLALKEFREEDFKKREVPSKEGGREKKS